MNDHIHVKEQNVLLINKRQKKKSTEQKILNESKASYYENNRQRMREKNLKQRGFSLATLYHEKTPRSLYLQLPYY